MSPRKPTVDDFEDYQLDMTSRLVKDVKRHLNATRGEDTLLRWAQSLHEHGGVITGAIPDLIYYSQQSKFYQKHKLEINALLAQEYESDGILPFKLVPQWSWDDPLALDAYNQGALARWAFDRATFYIIEELEGQHDDNPLPALRPILIVTGE